MSSTSGQILGTPAYISPEQAQAQTEAVGPQSDVYSIGAVLYHLLTQRPPFAAESLPALLDLVVHREPVSRRALNPSVPQDLETVCLKCLHKDPASRYRSARDLSDELGRFGRGEPILARPPNVAERAWRWCARNRALSASLGTAAILLVAGVVVRTWQAVRAKAEAARSRQIAHFLQDMLKGVGPSVAQGWDTKMLREILDQTAGRIGKELEGQPVAEAEPGGRYRARGGGGREKAARQWIIRMWPPRSKTWPRSSPMRARFPKPRLCTARYWRFGESSWVTNIQTWLRPSTVWRARSRTGAAWGRPKAYTAQR